MALTDRFLLTPTIPVPGLLHLVEFLFVITAKRRVTSWETAQRPLVVSVISAVTVQKIARLFSAESVAVTGTIQRGAGSARDAIDADIWQRRAEALLAAFATSLVMFPRSVLHK
jgi:hypothetical protein